jgi:hypothetical protein
MFSTRRILLIVGGLVLIAGIVFASLVLFRGKPPAWRLLSANGSATVSVDGTPVPAPELAKKPIPSGSHLAIGGEGRIRIGIPGMAEITLEPNSEITIGSSKGGIEGNLPAVTLHRGSLRGEATPQFHGLWVESYTASTLIQGAPATVAVHHDTLDVQVIQGGADVLVKASGEMAHVPAGGRLLMVGAENPTVTEPSNGMEGSPGTALPESAAAGSAPAESTGDGSP